jgi:DNA-binding transcriptional ArsR family regulator
MFKIAAHELGDKAVEVAQTLRTLGNDKRLAILCKLAENGEMNVTELARSVDLSQSALSQHLARLRGEGVVGWRRDSQTIWYKLDNPQIEAFMVHLYEVFCAGKAGQ